MITLRCCEENYYAAEMHIGGHIRCRKCGRILTIEPQIPPSTTHSGHAVAARSETAASQASPIRSVSLRTAWGRRRLPLLGLAIGGVFLIVLFVWVAVARFAIREGQSSGAPEVQTPVPAKAQTSVPSTARSSARLHGSSGTRGEDV